MDIHLEKEANKFADVSQECMAKLFKTLGIDIKNEVLGSEIKNKIISVYFAKGISLDRFCKEESIKITEGVRTGFIKPAGKTDITVTIKDLDFNTPDSFVIEYLNKFGTVVSQDVIYGKYADGPFKGKFNGDRKYQIKFEKSSRSMGSYHLIDGVRTRIFYAGNKKSCARCHQNASTCVGEANAKTCEENGGNRISLAVHMEHLWKSVGFKPENFELGAWRFQ